MEVLQKLYQETKNKYSLRLLAGEKGLTNTVSWIYLMEDMTHYPFIKESELIVTTGLVYKSEEELLSMVENLVGLHASGLIINTGQYIFRIPDSVKALCDEKGFPLFEMPWKSSIASLSRDYYERVLDDDLRKKSIRSALIGIIEEPESVERYMDVFREYGYSLQDQYSCAVLSFDRSRDNTPDFFHDVEVTCRNSLNAQNYNYVLFHYHQKIVFIGYQISRTELREMVLRMQKRLCERTQGSRSHAGIGNLIEDISDLHKAYRQACAACEIAKKDGEICREFEDIGIYQILFSVDNAEILCEYGRSILRPVLEYDRQHNSDFLQTLKCYIEYNANVQRVAEESCMHRNTVNYRIRKMKEMLDNPLENMSQLFPVQMAFYILSLYPGFCEGEKGGSYEK